MDQHPIPRQITTFEFKLIGFMTLRQFLYLIVAFPVAYVVFTLFPIPLLNILLAVLIVVAGIVTAFVPIRDRSLDVWVRNIWKRLQNPTQYYYQKKNDPLYFLKDLYFLADPHHMLAHIESKEKLSQYLAMTKQKQRPNYRKKQVGALLQSPTDQLKKQAPNVASDAAPPPVSNEPTLQQMVDGSAPLPEAKPFEPIAAPVVPMPAAEQVKSSFAGLAQPIGGAPLDPPKAVLPAAPAPSPVITAPAAAPPVQPQIIPPAPVPQQAASPSVPMPAVPAPQVILPVATPPVAPSAPPSVPEPTPISSGVPVPETVDRTFKPPVAAQQVPMPPPAPVQQTVPMPTPVVQPQVIPPEPVSTPTAVVQPQVVPPQTQAQPAPVAPPPVPSPAPQQASPKVQTPPPAVVSPPNQPFFVGVIRNSKKIPLPGIMVYIKDDSGSPVRLMKTNPHGVFATYNPLNANDYTFEIKDPNGTYFFDTMKVPVRDSNPAPIEFQSKEIL